MIRLICENYDQLLEASRKELVAKTKSQSPERFKKRLSYGPRDYHGVDMKDLLVNDTLTFTTPVGDYICTISFKGVFKYLKKEVGQNPRNVRNKRNRINLDLQGVIRALNRAFDAADVLVDCSCPDFYYRYSYVATKNGYKYGTPQDIPADIRNPHDDKGGQCKHLTALLSNKKWISRVASAINSYLKAYPEVANRYLLDALPMKDDSNDSDEEPELDTDE